MKYSYGLQTIESRSMYEKERVLGVKFYNASKQSMIGQVESHGLSYYETRIEYEKIGHVMGLEKLL